MRPRLWRFARGWANLLLVVTPPAALEIFLRGRVPPALGMLLMTAALVALYLAGARWIERRRAVELEVDRSMAGIGTGLALGVALFSSVMGILWLARVYRPAGWGRLEPLAMGLSLALMGAVFEEILFRGFLFRLFAGLGGNWAALGVTAALFGLAHMANPHATPASSAAIAIEAGILLGAAYAASGSLWLPIGIHAGWNFAEGSLFGMAISGNALPAGLIRGSLEGPAMLTGGAFGPEASLVAVAVCLGLAVVYLRRMKAAAV